MLAIVLIAYFMQIIGSLWPSRNGETGADILQPYSLFHYLDPNDVLTQGIQLFDLAVLLVVGGACRRLRAGRVSSQGPCRAGLVS